MPDLTQVRVTAKGHRVGFEGQVLEPGVRDLAGLGLASDLIFTYTTGDVTKPRVVSVHPADKALDVPLRSVFRVEFSEPVDPKSIRAFTLNRDGKREEGRLNSQPIMGGRVIVFTPSTPLRPNAQYEVKIEGPVTDVAGNAMEPETLHFRFATLDTVPPVIRNLAMAPGITAVEGKSVPIVVEFEDDSDLAFVEYYLNRELVQTAHEAPFGSRIHLDPSLGREMIISAIGVDQAGNRSQPSLLPLEISPNSPPAVRITSPVAGQVSAGQLVALKVEATDDVGVAELGYTVNEGKVASGRKEISPATAAQLTFSFKIPMDYEIGSDIVIRAVAGDTGGQVAVSDTIILAVLGKLPPAVALVGVENNSSLDPGDDIRVSVQADDPTGVVEVSLSGTGVLTFSELRTIDPPSSKPEKSFVFKMPANASPTQTLTLTGRAVDTRGNAGSRSVTLRINDRIAPVASLIQPRGKTKVEPGTEIPLMVKASDEIGVEKIDLLVNGELVQSREIASKKETTQHFKLFVSEDVELETDLHVKASVHDAAGNIGENTLILLAKDLRAPSVSIVSSAVENKILAGKTLRVKIKAEDSFGVASIRYKVTGVVKAHGEFSIDPVGESAEREFDLKVPEEAAGGGTVSIISNATDRSGNTRDTYWLNIRVLDVVPPKVIVVKPPDAATDVDPAIHVRLRFSEPISRRTVSAESMVLKGPDGVVPGSFYFDRWSRDANFKPAQPLERGGRYTVTASTAITDPTGNPLQEVFTSHFTTDSTGPALAELIPEDGADGVAALPVIRARFNEALKRESVTPEAISLVDASGEAIPTETKWRDRDRTLELRPKEALSLGSQYTIRISGLLTDIAGNSITDADGTPIDELIHRFTTGTIRFLSPLDGGTVLEKTRIPLEISPEGLAVASVVFEVNGQRSPAVPGPVFRMAYHVPAMVDAPNLTITAIAMDEKGKEIARKSLSTTVVPGLQNEPAILGVSKGGESYFRLFLSVPLETDLPLKLAVQEPSVARLPREPLVLRAGKKELRVPVEGVSKGNTFLTIQSERGNAALTVSVSEPSPGTQQTVSSLPMGLCIQRAAFAQSLLIPEAGDYSLSIPLLATPARSEISVEVSARPGDILDVSDRATIASGSRLARVSLKAKAVGEAALRLKVEDTVTQLRLVVGEPVQEAMQFLSGVASRPIGLSLKALPSPGPIHLPRTGTYTLTVPLLARPLTAKTRVKVSNRTPAIVEVEEDDVSIAEGSHGPTLALKAKGEGKGEVFLTTGDQVYRLPIIVGDVETTLPPAAASQPVGMAVTPPAFSGQLIIPHLGKHRISVPLLPSVATEKTEVMLFSDDPDVMAVQPKAVILDGSRMAQVSLHLKQAGSAQLKMQVGNEVTWLPVTIGPAPETFMTGVGPKPLGLEVSPPGTGGRVFLNSGAETLIRLPLLSVPATEEISVELHNRHPEISQATAASAVIPVGERALEITVRAKPGVTGTALTDLVFMDRLKTLEVIVGQPSAGDKPIIVSPVVGFEVKK